jgi:FkbM family methyltransferase
MMLPRVGVFLAEHTPRGLKSLLHKIPFLNNSVMWTYGTFLRNSVLPIKDGPLRGMKLATDRHTSHAHINGTYEREVQEATDRMVNPGDICYDLGASIGYISLVMARKAKHVYAFEPSPIAIEEMKRHIAANGLQNVTIVPTPVSSTVKDVRFCVTDVAYGSSINETETKWPILRLKTTTVDLFAKDYEAPDFMKIDVEGEEGAVLDGARQTLARRKTSICCEIHNQEAARSVLDILREFDYDVRLMNGSPAKVPQKILQGDFHVLARPR